MSVVPLLFEELTRLQLQEIAPAALAVLPVGATEQHGPHLPAGTDAMHAEHVARAAAARITGRVPVVVTPTLAFGSSPHHLPFGATLSLSTQTFGRVLHDLCTSLVGAGFRQIFIVNGHGGNHELIQIAARDLALAYPVSVAAGSWWAIAWDALVAGGACDVGRLPGHAGGFETSVVLALRPELVHEPRPHRDQFAASDPRGYAAAYRVETPDAWLRIDGYSDSPDRGTAEQGRRFLELAIGAVADALLEFAEAKDSGKDASGELRGRDTTTQRKARTPLHSGRTGNGEHRRGDRRDRDRPGDRAGQEALCHPVPGRG
jgi:creatinine amidohydrolase